MLCERVLLSTCDSLLPQPRGGKGRSTVNQPVWAECRLPSESRHALARALAEDSAWSRIHLGLLALTELRPEGAVAFVQCSLWHMPRRKPVTMQRLRMRYVCRPGSLDPDRLGHLFAADMTKVAGPGVEKLHEKLNASPEDEIVDDYAAICTPEVWNGMEKFRESFAPLGLGNGFTHYWRVNDKHCLNATTWIADVSWESDTDRRDAARCLFRLLRPLMEQILVHDRVGQRIEALTARQRDVLRLVLAGLSEKQIAAALHRSANTVHTHIRELYRYFEVQSRAELMALFINEEDLPPAIAG